MQCACLAALHEKTVRQMLVNATTTVMVSITKRRGRP